MGRGYSAVDYFYLKIPKRCHTEDWAERKKIITLNS